MQTTGSETGVVFDIQITDSDKKFLSFPKINITVQCKIQNYKNGIDTRYRTKNM